MQPAETNWLDRLSKKYQSQLNELLPQIKASSETDYLIVNDMIDLVFAKQQDLGNDAFLNVLAKKVEEVNQVVNTYGLQQMSRLY